ncbi:MAG: hypothetical protein HKN67_02435 [Saprospiraceae bacterium]|nr:hypothetical protein [Saprospiraceae bacterium]
MNKPRIVKDFEKLSEEVLAQIKLEYPLGFEKKLILFKNKEGKFVSALPFETEEFNYLIRMTPLEAQQIIEEDDDYDDEGNLTDEAIERLEEEIED